MPQERDNKYPHFTRADWDRARAGVPRHIQAARLVLASKVTGIPNRPYLAGDSDHAPVMQGVAELTDAVYNLLDALADQIAPHDPTTTAAIDIVLSRMETFNGV